eukprot:CAMPEP_0183725188 /NCGR_PEP_ID=MMETSP0737-20130205/19681_1 /TAXON_ID=385413 /ORGANISM="Thalassiosira miniscula, Strain CCMP1093" /LENGTH=87 /DNA_ID=CAMNT_0025956047 /DNA_START=170 /DNA_END=433 /DNA_ORIENTATION=+
MTIAEYAERNIGETEAFMGLEAYLSRDTLRGIQRRRRLVCRAVKLEQQRQRANNIQDPEALANESCLISQKSAHRARIIGLLHSCTS